MGWTSYNKFGEIVFSADTLDGYSSEDFVFKAGDVLLGNLGVDRVGAALYTHNPVSDAYGELTPTSIGLGLGSTADFTLSRTAANVATLGTGDKIRDTSDPDHADALTRRSWVEAQISALAVSGAAVPTGTILDFAGAAAPTGFLLCQGQEVSRTTYPTLDTLIGTTFGAYTNGAGAAGTTHMRLPDFRGRVSVGAGTGAGESAAGAAGTVPSGTALTARTRGAWGGGELVVLTPANTPLRSHTHTGTTGTESADHAHSGSTGTVSSDHSHSGGTGGRSAFHNHYPSNNQGFVTGPVTNTWPIPGTGTTRVIGQSAAPDGTTNVDNQDHSHAFTTGGISANHTHAFDTGGRNAAHTHSFTTSSPSVAEANGTGHANVQPFLVVNKIIKT